MIFTYKFACLAPNMSLHFFSRRYCMCAPTSSGGPCCIGITCCEPIPDELAATQNAFENIIPQTKSLNLADGPPSVPLPSSLRPDPELRVIHLKLTAQCQFSVEHTGTSGHSWIDWWETKMVRKRPTTCVCFRRDASTGQHVL